jgi:hypothetical protein
MKSPYLWLAFLTLPTAAAAANPCANLKAGVTIAEISHADGVMKASGTWEVGEGVPSALVEYRIQGDRYWVESRTGTSGAWQVSIPWTQCNRSSLRVDVLPSVKVGDVLVYCWENVKATSQRFVVNCAPTAELGPCQWECSDEKPLRCSGTCTGTGQGGTGYLVGMYGVNGESYQFSEATEGVWTWTVTCAPGDKVSFRVRDKSGSGVLSEVAERLCGQE